jgi:biopolymer transport protein ExbD
MSDTSHLAEPQINTTPLIDVMLVLLVMLILVVPIATHNVQVDLPVGRPGGTPPPAVRLEILYRGEMYWNGQHVASIEELTPKFAAIASQTNPPLLKVMAERMAPYERVAQVLAAAQRSNVLKLSINPIPD